MYSPVGRGSGQRAVRTAHKSPHQPMVMDIEMIRRLYGEYPKKVAQARKMLGKPMTLAEKILYAHLYSSLPERRIRRLEDYALFRPDRVAMQDATAQMAVLQFMNAGKSKVAVPSTVHCDHLICACDGAETDLKTAKETNAEVYDFLKSASSAYGIGFWEPGAGIIHQVILEKYAFPGGMMVGTDSHTPNAGGLGMVAIGVGGADAVDVMTGMEWELKMPRLIGVRLKGSLKGWASAKDVILKLAGILTVKGGTNAIIEYFGEGASSLSCTGKASICNMGAEVGATTSVFPFDAKMSAYLKATGREEVAQMAEQVSRDLKADPEVYLNPEEYYDQIIDIDLDSLEPHVNGPFTPDAACGISGMKEKLEKTGYPAEVQVSLIGSCTNSSYQDISRAASIAKAALDAGLQPKASLIVNPGSNRISATAGRDGIMKTLKDAGAIVMANACGPCIGQWKRKTDDPLRRNSIVTSFNRNFAKRADGNPNTHAFIVSPEMAVALAFAGRLDFDPRKDSVNGFSFPEPQGQELPAEGFAECAAGYIAPQDNDAKPVIREDSQRLQMLKPFPAWDGKDICGLDLLIKTKGKCTTDHISMAGPWLRFRGHLENISKNMLMGAVNAFSGKTNCVHNFAEDKDMEVWASAKAYGQSIVVAEDNYGEGSSREHAAMEPRFLGVKAIIAKSFARIHETNLKKQGVLALNFINPDDYEKVREGDVIDVKCGDITPGSKIELVLNHRDGNKESIWAKHSYNDQQIKWLKAGSALNSLKN